MRPNRQFPAEKFIFYVVRVVGIKISQILRYTPKYIQFLLFSVGVIKQKDQPMLLFF